MAPKQHKPAVELVGQHVEGRADLFHLLDAFRCLDENRVRPRLSAGLAPTDRLVETL
jgi:hypothetical protein